MILSKGFEILKGRVVSRWLGKRRQLQDTLLFI